MKPILPLLLTLALGACSSRPVYAQETKEMAVYMIRQLQSAGVNVVLKEHCIENLYGHYHKSKRQVTLCKRSADNGLLVETITHEMVHVIQDCLEGRLGDNQSTSLYVYSLQQGEPRQADRLKNGVLSKLKRRYKSIDLPELLDPNLKVQEYEAYALEDNPDQVVKLFRSACLNR
jgi:hypothetical protein